MSTPVCTCPTDADVTSDMRDETGQHLATCGRARWGVDLSSVAKFPQTCDHEVSRKGESQPCEKPAVAVKLHDGEPFPVCKHHSFGQMVPLSQLLAWGVERADPE